MPIGEICVREVVVAPKETTVQDAAHMMRQHHVGNVLIVDRANGDGAPVGIVTDRDITISVVATKLDPSVFTLGDLVTEKLVAAQEDQGIFETIQQMRLKGIRRMPVVTREGKLVGIVSIDDVIQLLAEEMSELSKLISHEQAREAQLRQ
jgi:CBS domain-containing protein